MHNTIERMRRAAFPRLNEVSYTFEDIEAITKREGIDLKFDSLAPDILGYLSRHKPPAPPGRELVINNKLDHVGRTFVGFHEIAHFYLHVPIRPDQFFYCPSIAWGTRLKHDCEADAVALMAMIPYPLMADLIRNPVDDLHPALVELSIRRHRLWMGRGV